jgi:hypothetical protein
MYVWLLKLLLRHQKNSPLSSHHPTTTNEKSHNSFDSRESAEKEEEIRKVKIYVANRCNAIHILTERERVRS